MLSSTSTRGRPPFSSVEGSTFTPVGRPLSSHTGATPRAARACASIKPWWRSVSPAHRLSARRLGAWPCLACSAYQVSNIVLATS